MLLTILLACLPPVLPDTGMVADTAGDTADTADTADTSDTASGDDADGDGFPAPPDCDDADADTYPAATEKFDFRDQDCDTNLVEMVQDHEGARSYTQTGFVYALTGLADAGGGPDLAAGIIADGTSRVAVTTIEDIRAGLTSGTAVTHDEAESFGYSLVAGDFDIDGEADLAMGDPGPLGAYFIASVSQFHGGILDAASLHSLEDSTGGTLGFAGTQVAGQVAVTRIAPGAEGTAVFLVGSAGLLDEVITTLDGAGVITTDEAASGFGANLAGLGLIGGDAPDLLVGAPAGSALRGDVFVFDGTTLTAPGVSLTTADADCHIVGQAASARLGGGTLGAGDVDDDGHTDVLLTTYATGGVGESRSWYLLLGGVGACDDGVVTAFADARVDGLSPYVLDAEIPLSMLSADARDLDGEPGNELVVGSPEESPGKVYVFRGADLATGATLDLDDAAAGLFGQTSGDNFGAVIGLVGASDTGLLVTSAPGAGGGTFWSVDLAF